MSLCFCVGGFYQINSVTVIFNGNLDLFSSIKQQHSVSIWELRTLILKGKFLPILGCYKTFSYSAVWGSLLLYFACHN